MNYSTRNGVCSTQRQRGGEAATTKTKTTKREGVGVPGRVVFSTKTTRLSSHTLTQESVKREYG